MTVRTFYQRALFAPVLLPLLLAPLLLVDDGMRTTAGGIIVYVAYSMVLGGVQYVAFALAFARWMRGRPDAAIRRAVWLAPVVFLPFLLLPWLVVEAMNKPTNVAERIWNAVALLGGFGLLFGYVYVLAAQATLALLERRGRVQREWDGGPHATTR